MSKITKDEQFLIKLYDRAKDEGDFDLEINYIEFGKEMVFKDKITKNIVRDLLHSNFVQKIDSETIKLTQNGITFAQKHKEGWVSQ